MCFWGGKQEPPPPVTVTPAPEPTPAPTPAPLPSPVPSETAPQLTAQERRRRIDTMRRGLLSTIKTPPKGTTGREAELAGEGAGKKTLGS